MAAAAMGHFHQATFMQQDPGRGGGAAAASAAAASGARAEPISTEGFEEEWRVISVTYPTALLFHEGKRINLYELVCGNFVGVRGRKLDVIRAKLGSAGFHLRVNHQLVEADEHHTFVAIQVSVLGIVMDQALQLLLDSFQAAAHGVLLVHPGAGEIQVGVKIGGDQLHASITPGGITHVRTPATTQQQDSAKQDQANKAVALQEQHAVSKAPQDYKHRYLLVQGQPAAPVVQEQRRATTQQLPQPQLHLQLQPLKEQRLQPWDRTSSGGSTSDNSTCSTSTLASSRPQSASAVGVSRTASRDSSTGGDDFMAKLLIGSDLLSLL